MKVRIKTWDKMEKEFELDEDDITVDGVFFTKPMESNMPDNRIINIDIDTDIDIPGNYIWTDHKINTWSITEEMIEEVIDVSIEDAFKKIKDFCHTYDVRLGQLMENIRSYVPAKDLFHLSNEEIIDAIEYFQEREI